LFFVTVVIAGGTRSRSKKIHPKGSFRIITIDMHVISDIKKYLALVISYMNISGIIEKYATKIPTTGINI